MSFQVNLQWREPRTKDFRTGVSLHSHTLHSVERLDFIYRAAVHVPALAAAIRQGERRYAKLHGASLDLSRGWWTPPLSPHDAWIVEKSQIEQLGLDALVSLTDHDDIEAPVRLHLLDECRQVPISVEWTVPFALHVLPFGNPQPASAASQGTLWGNGVLPTKDPSWTTASHTRRDLRVERIPRCLESSTLG